MKAAVRQVYGPPEVLSFEEVATPNVADMAVAIVQNQANEAEQEDIDRMLSELEALPDEQAQGVLSDENQSTTGNSLNVGITMICWV